jgi:hypothetical protein
MMERIRTVEHRKVGGITSGVYRSDDYGDTWILLGPADGLPGPAVTTGRIGLAHNNYYDLAFALYADSTGAFMALYRSDYLGEYWSRPDDVALANLNGSWNGGWYFGQIETNGLWPYLFAGGLNVIRGDLSESTWEEMDNTMHVDIHAFHYGAAFGELKLYVGTDGGVYYSDQEGDWGTYVSRDGMANTQFYTVEMTHNTRQESMVVARITEPWVPRADFLMTGERFSARMALSWW